MTEYRLVVEWTDGSKLRSPIPKSADPQERLAQSRAHIADVKSRFRHYGVVGVTLEQREEATPWKRTQE